MRSTSGAAVTIAPQAVAGVRLAEAREEEGEERRHERGARARRLPRLGLHRGG